MKVYKEAANQRLPKKGHKINTSIFYRKKLKLFANQCSIQKV